MIVDAEYDEIEQSTNELDLAHDEGLPWLEAEEEDARGGGVDTRQLIGFVAILLVILLGVPGAIYYFSNTGSGSGPVADGSTIAAPEGAYKVRPEEAGGKEFAGTGDVAPGVGQGESSEARLADGADAGDGALNIAMPPIEGGGSAVGSSDPSGGSDSGALSSTATQTPTAPASSANSDTSSGASGVGVQLAAYSTRARAEKGWRDLKRMSRALSQYKHRVVEGRIDIGTVYRLQAVAPNRAEADSLCRTLKSQGLDCQVKP